jgi:acetate kinase
MKVLVVNCGSSSLKFQLIDMETESVLAKGKCDKIGLKGKDIGKPFVEYKKEGSNKIIEETDLPDHIAAFKEVVKYLTDKDVGAIKDLSEISAIGHRIVNGGPIFKESILITDDVLKQFEASIPYAPLHNPPALQGIYACLETMPNIKEVLVFDTTFHQTMPQKAYLYGIPYKYYENYGVRRYGAHGMSHRYVAEKAAEMLGKKLEDTNIISCHLGNGSSVSAVKNGKCVDTSMGFTPLEGLIMGTRSGDLDPAILEFIMKQENLTISEMTDILNKKSGLLGISGLASDVRDLKVLRSQGNEKAKLALELLCYRVRKYIGAYMAVLGRVDAITFEGGIGEHNLDVVKDCISELEEFGIEFNDNYINEDNFEGDTSTPNSRIKILIIQTNEEIIIAKDTVEIISKK